MNETNFVFLLKMNVYLVSVVVYSIFETVCSCSGRVRISIELSQFKVVVFEHSGLGFESIMCGQVLVLVDL
jgi:hypothetical protein